MDSYKLIYLHQYFTVPTLSGGTRSWEFSTRLVKDKWQVSMICGDSELTGISSDTVRKLFDNRDVDKFELNAIPSEYSNNMSFSQRIMAFIGFAVKSSKSIARTESRPNFRDQHPPYHCNSSLIT
ncbi:MAG: hypothetical protein MJK14_00570 [Rivularia sp. ALOHA_DT_140]|nr:hypothetical protein [Rivularia sp. ALOHA_DT_140]